MARKSKEMLWREKLGSISNCPADIFDHLEASTELLDIIEKAENGDVLESEKLVLSLLQVVLDKRCKCDAFKYLCAIAIHRGSIKAVDMYLDYVVKVGDGIELLSELANSDYKGEIRDRILEVKAICDAVLTKEENVRDLLSYIDEKNISNDVKIYVLSHALGLGLEVKDKLLDICSKEHISAIVALPTVGYGEFDEVEDKEDILDKLRAYLLRIDNGEWRDFWIRCMYEYCEKYRSCDFSLIAKDIINVAYERQFSKKRLLHSLVWAIYLKEHGKLDTGTDLELEKTVAKLEDECSFAGQILQREDSAAIAQLMKEAVYTFSEKEKVQSEQLNSLGNIIVHGRNRYSLECTLKKHAKRGKKHFWEITASFPLEGNKEYPIFTPIKINSVNNHITRGGVNLDYDRNISQILGSGEVEIDTVRHPFTIDFILDIAYISAVKCEDMEFKIKNMEEVDNYLVMLVQIFLS